MHSPWTSRFLKDLGHRVLVANPRKVRAIYQNIRKSDRRDAEMLARIARTDETLLYPPFPQITIMETPDQYMHRATKCDRAVAGTSADGMKRSFMDGAQRSPKGEAARKRVAESTLNPLFPAQARGCRPAPRRADARSTAFGFAPNHPDGFDYVPPSMRSGFAIGRAAIAEGHSDPELLVPPANG